MVEVLFETLARPFDGDALLLLGVFEESRVVEIQDPDGYKYQVKAGPKLAIEKLKVGDRLLATYAATVAIAIDKKP